MYHHFISIILNHSFNKQRKRALSNNVIYPQGKLTSDLIFEDIIQELQKEKNQTMIPAETSLPKRRKM